MSAIIMTPAQTQRYYNAYFGRPADPSGLNFWVNGVTADPVASVIKLFGSPTTPEFSALYPAGTSPEVFLTRVYANMFNRGPDADGLKFWADAFRASVAGGVDEGTARAWIVVEIERAAWGQTGTNDKFSLVNKQLVAEAMTASVKQYGTEAAYLSDLPDARALLASVNHTQASVDAALGRIKFGFVDGIDPGTGAPAIPATVVYAGQFPDGVNLDPAKKEILKISSVKDAPFSFKKLYDGATVEGGLPVAKIEVGRDKIDLTSFNLNVQNIAADLLVRSQPWTGTDWANWVAANPDGTPPAYKTYPGFFNGKMFAAWESGVGQPWFATSVLVDVNKNGNLDPEADLWLVIHGVGLGSINEVLFII